MPLADLMVLMAPHPGQGELLLRMIDPSVTDEDDPRSVDPALDPYSGSNGFAPAPEPSVYSPEFIDEYRAAQRARVARIDAKARERVARAREAQGRFKQSGDPADRRDALATELITVYRTDADLRCVDPTLDPNLRPYGSLFGSRPDLTNYGVVGFGRLTTPEAWLSTWSGLSSRAGFIRCAPAIQVPTLFIEITGDQACFPADAIAMVAALGTSDVEHVRVRGKHFGAALRGFYRRGGRRQETGVCETERAALTSATLRSNSRFRHANCGHANRLRPESAPPGASTPRSLHRWLRGQSPDPITLRRRTNFAHTILPGVR